MLCVQPDLLEPLKQKSILLIEDMADVRETMQTLLEIWGYQVETAEDGMQGLMRAVTLKPSIAIVDIGLPKMSGLEVARRIRKSCGLEGMLLIALTGFSCPSDRGRSLEAGFDAHFIKPVAIDVLASVLAERRNHPACQAGRARQAACI